MSRATAGIRVRHSKLCRTRSDGACSCKPTYEANVWSASDGKRAYKAFATIAAAKAWRADVNRAGLSHFLRLEQAERIRRSPVSRVAAVELRGEASIYVARTARTPGHVTVWAPKRCSGRRGSSRDGRVAYHLRMRFLSLFAGADLIGEFETREEAERALDEHLSAARLDADAFAVFEFDENGKRVGEPITHAAA